jgi:hypothetical protein
MMTMTLTSMWLPLSDVYQGSLELMTTMTSLLKPMKLMMT